MQIIFYLFYLDMSFIVNTFGGNHKTMSKKKKKNKVNDWFDQIFRRKRANRAHKLPITYIESLSDDFHKNQPTRQIIVNTLAEFAETLLAKGYMWHISDAKFFRAKQEKHFEEDWNHQRTLIDDLINNKSNQ